MKILKNILVALGIAVAADAPAATVKTGEPDFAHPRQVLQEAYKVLESTAGDSAAGPQRVKALLEVCTAAQSIDPDSVFSLVALCDRLANKEVVPVASSLMRLVGAKVLFQAYEQNRYVYDRLTTPATPVPIDIREWNGEQFRTGVASRMEQAFKTAVENPAALSEYAPAVKADERTLMYFPRVVDFVACSEVGLYEEINMHDKALELKERMRDASPAGSAAYYYWAVSLLENAPEKELYEFYMAHEGDEYARMALIRLAEWATGNSEVHVAYYDEEEGEVEKDVEPDAEVSAKTVAELIDRSLERFPGYWDNARLRNQLDVLRRGKVSVNYPRLVCPGRPFEINITGHYVAKAGASIYELNNNSKNGGRNQLFSSLKLVSKLERALDNVQEDITFNEPVILGRAGTYVVYASANGTINSSKFVDTSRPIVATPYVPLCFTGTVEQVVAMTDFVTGAPVKGVRVYAKDNTDAIQPAGETNDSGLVRFKLPMHRWAKLLADAPGGELLNFGWGVSVTSPGRFSDEISTYYRAAILPDRPIYHPGDSVQWAVVVDLSNDGNKSRHAAEGLQVKVDLYDANRQHVGGMDAVADVNGRVFGAFALPTDGLTGYYRLEVKVNDSYAGSRRVMVSDFKMPTFEVTDLMVVRDAPERGAVTLRGRAETYSGMPVADATVAVEVNKSWRWRWWQPAEYLGSLEGMTDAGGNFELVVPADMLESYKGADFLATVTVTAKSAETAMAKKSFTTGRPYAIHFSGDGRYLRALSKTQLPVEVYDARGEKVNIALRWRLVDEGTGKAVASGRCSSLNPVADLDKVHGGYYKLIVEPEDKALAEAATSPRYIIYNVELNSIPADLPLLVTETQVKSDAAGRASFRYGVGRDNVWLYAALCVGEEIVEAEVQKRNKGFRHLSLELPDGADTGVLEIATVVDGRICSYRVLITRPAAPQLTIEGESFRDRLVPGAREHWTLKISGPGAGGAAVAATMYNHALDALEGFDWPRNFALTTTQPVMSLETPSIGKGFVSRSIELKKRKESTLSDPAFRYLLNVAYGRYYSMGAPRMMMKAMAMATADAATGAVMNDMAMPMAAEIESEEEAGNGSAQVEDPAQEQFNFREAEVLQAFWMPDLTTDADGNVTLDFEVPDANTTWRFMALAWTAEMKAGSMVRDIVANKPVMVQPNLPRFMRQGDKARVLATVYNNSEESAAVTTTVEIFRASDMAVVATAESTDEIPAGGQAIVGIDIEAPMDATALGYRVRSTDGRFSDGEQAFIPIEPAECDVVESQPFYLNPGDKELSLRIPSDKKGTYTLQYCQNPSWSIVKALPGLVTFDATTSDEAVNTLFAACTSRGIVNRNPAVVDALKAWNDTPPASRLAQNDALKTVALNASPWVQAAQSDAERMARLSLLLDPANAEAQIKAAVKVLEKLAETNGGIKWGPWSREASEWATLSALHDLGLLRMAGDLPADATLDRLMRNALGYIDRQLEINSRKKIGPDMNYTVVRSLWQGIEPSAFGRKVIDATLRHCETTWRNASTARKANMAILLSLYGRDRVAAEIIGSLNEFAVESPSQGVSFPSVDFIEQYAPMLIAYGRVDPTSALIDGMRQWLVVREQATVGLGAWDATQLVWAFMSSGTPWHTDNAPATVTLKGQPVDLGDACSYGGEATVALGSHAAGKTLTIAPGADVPSFGAVISNYRTRPSQVKAVDCDGLSVEKRMMLVVGDGTTSYATEVPLGSRVRVLLTLHVARDMEYVNLVDERAAALEPVVQTPGMVESAGAYFYRENRDASTRMFIGYLPKGTYQISYDCTANVAGVFAGGLATVQSALAPSLTAHSAGSELTVK